MIFLFLVFIVIASIYNPWFDLTKTLSSGDWPYLYPENIASFRLITEPPFLWLEPYYQITAKLGVHFFSLSWELTEKIFWFYPFLIISIISSYSFLKYLAKILGIDKNSLVFISIGSLIFTTNTYILMLVGGGQMGVAIAYSMAPLVLFRFIKIVDNAILVSHNFKFQILNFKLLIYNGFIFAIQLMFDPRIFLLTIIIGIMYLGISLFLHRTFSFSLLKTLLLILGIAFLLNLFWVLPNIEYFNTEYKSAIDAANASYLSFATFPNSISLLHPNWPDNVFGKVGFMKSVFIVLAILAYSSLLIISKVNPSVGSGQKSNRTILFFAFLGLFGAFLAKGTNPPFGELYEWLSDFPGFSIFRDPTKFYLLVVVSYMVLVPLSIYYSTDWLKSKIKNQKSKIQFNIQKYGVVLFSLAFLAYWLFLIRSAIFGQLTGTFKPHDVPKEYVNLKDFLYSQSESTKTLWVPSIERFGFNSRIKPAISSMEIFGVNSVSEVLDKLDKSEVRRQIMDEEVKYVIVPYDYLKEIFLTDRKYDNRLYMQAINKLKDVYWLRAVVNNNIGRIKVFEIIY